jgi:mannose-6-phosphate isomerase
MKLGPLLFIPKLVPKIWGSELWHVFDREGESAVVAKGPFQGQTLHALMDEFGPGLLGPQAFAAEPDYFPLAFKIIEAREALSLQVHPDGDQAARMGHGERGKNEMWLLLEAEPGATITAGLKPGVTREKFLKALKEGDLDGVVDRFAVKAGDAVDVPAGRLHSIGKGCRVAEIQENSDTTLRVHDYGRLENGKPRELHLGQALECIRFGDQPRALLAARPIQGGEETLLAGPQFKVSRLGLAGAFAPPPGPPSFHLLHGLEGSTRIESEDGPFEIKAGETALIPASLDWRLASAAASKLLWSRP